MAVGPEHECRQGRRCKARIKDDEGAFHGTGVEQPGSLCRPCEEHAFAAIKQLADDYQKLIPARTEIRSTVSGPKVSGSSERPILIRLGPDTLMSDMDHETTMWANRILRGSPIPNDDTFTVLSTSLGTLIGMPRQEVTVWVPVADGGDDTTRIALDGVDAVLRLARLHERALNVLGLVETVTWLRETCHMCGLRTLTMSLEYELITCRNCRNCWHQDDFARLNNPVAA